MSSNVNAVPYIGQDLPSYRERIELRKAPAEQGTGYLILSHRRDGTTLVLGAVVKPKS